MTFLVLVMVFARMALCSASQLFFNSTTGQFKILQIADMHYANGATTQCEDVLPEQFATCSDLNTSAFMYRMIDAEKPDLIVFTGDNIYGVDCNDSAASQIVAFAPAINAKIPWAAVLGNHDQEGNLDRLQLMQHIVSMDYALAQINPPSSMGFDGRHDECGLSPHIDGYGNYNLEVGGAQGSSLANKSVLNLYFLDSGDYSTVPDVSGYGWIKPSQQVWFLQTSAKLQAEYRSDLAVRNDSAPGLAYFHIPVPEFKLFDTTNMTGVKQEAISSASVNSGFFTTMVEAGDVKAAFVGHDHVNDFCGEVGGVSLCYGGGFGYHAYGSAGWPRRARVVMASLGKDDDGKWSGVKEISTWKRLDDGALSTLDKKVLWSASSTTSST